MSHRKPQGVPALLWKRIGALVLDLLVINFTIFSPFRSLFLSLVPNSNFGAIEQLLDSNPALTTKISMLMLIFGILALLYFSLLEYFTNQTIGKMILGLSVEPQANKLKLWQCFIRNLFVLPVFPFMLFWIIDPLYLLFSKSNQRLLEKWSGTMVYQKVNWQKVKEVWHASQN